MRWRLWWAAVTSIVIAQVTPPTPPQAPQTAEPPRYRYLGEPITLNFQCTNSDIVAHGLHCTEQAPCPVYLELAAAGGVGDRIFASGSFHTGGATLYSVLLASPDGGTTWYEPTERIPGARLGEVYFATPRAGWVLGHMWNRQPSSPFFLATTDGGEHWRRYPILEEATTAVVDEFWFDSESTGVVIIDRLYPTETGARFERYDTMTGGASWMVREISAQPIDVRRLRPLRPQPQFRVRPNAQGQLWLIEKAEGDNWQVVAEFTMAAGQCAYVPEPVTPPPEPEAPKPPVEEPGGIFRIPGPGQAAPPPSTPPPQPKRPPTLKREGER